MSLKGIGQRLRRERERLNWSQERLAEVVGTTARTINRWEQDKVLPHPHYREKLCALFHLSTEVLFNHADEELSIQPRIWNVPVRRNPLFTGREDVLEALANALHTKHTVALTQVQAISGLGGIGKTQIAIEYAYRYQENYEAVLWMRAETREILLADLIALAEPLELPERFEHEQQLIVAAVINWLRTHHDWLLLLDNVEEVMPIADLLSECSGHILLTTRAQAIGPVAQRIEVAPMATNEATLLLMRRAQLISPTIPLSDIPEDLSREAERLSQELGGLPLALDQAGAYIEETGCSFADYRERYARWPEVMLARRGNVAGEHPASVLTTFFLSLQLLERMSPTVVNLLQLCAFFQPDAIPEELFLPTSLAPQFSPAINPVEFDEALAILRRYSLLKRDPSSKTVSIHRLVQVAIQASLPQETHALWAERVLVLVNAHFPNNTYGFHTLLSTALVSQVYCCAELIQRWNIATREATQFLLKLVSYFQWKGELAEADRLIHQIEALFLSRGVMPFAEVIPLWNLQAHQACEQGRYAESAAFAHRALHWSSQLFGPTHALIAESADNLSEALFSLGQYAEAQMLAEQALHLKKQLWGEADARLVVTLNNLSNVFYRLEHYKQSAQLLHSAVEIAQKTPDFDIILLALIYSDLGYVYRDMQRYEEAIEYLKEALRLRDDLEMSHHPYQALTLNDLSGCYFRQGNYAEAERVLRQALAIQRDSLQPEHESIAITLNNLAKNLAAQGKHDEAEELYQQALALFEQAQGKEHLNVSVVCINLAQLAEKQQSLEKAAHFYQRASQIQVSIFGPEHPKVVQIAEWYQAVCAKC